MNYSIKEKLKLKPKTLFLFDSLGALATAFFLFVILRTYNPYFGMPKITLAFLSLIALIFCIYSATCFFLLKHNFKPFLKIIVTANLLYCCLTISLIVYYYPILTILGVVYFLTEVTLIFGLVFLELMAITNRKISKANLQNQIIT